MPSLPDAGQRRHHESVGQFQLAEGHRRKQHAVPFTRHWSLYVATARRLQLFHVRLGSLEVDDGSRPADDGDSPGAETTLAVGVIGQREEVDEGGFVRKPMRTTGPAG